MGMATQQKIIDGKSCVVVQYPGMEGLKIWTNLVKLLGPSIALLGKSLGGGDVKDIQISEIMDREVDMGNLFASISEALVLASDKIDENIMEQLILRILSSTKIDNQEINSNSFNLMFCGNYGLLFKLVAFVLKVNYESFLGDRGQSTVTDLNKNLSSVQN